ncbi:MAG: BlaI/MecI/CopY family transcriptional regulator [Gemmataceae bacterium]
MASEQSLSRRERQIMDALFQTGEATAAEVHERLPAAPSYSAVRTLLRILEEKGVVEHRTDGRRYVYRPLVSPRLEGQSALQRVLRVFFGGSLEQALAAHFSDPKVKPDDAELSRLRALIESQAVQDTRETRKGKKL